MDKQASQSFRTMGRQKTVIFRDILQDVPLDKPFSSFNAKARQGLEREDSSSTTASTTMNSRSRTTSSSSMASDIIITPRNNIIVCVACAGDVRPLAYRCETCPAFILCVNCLVGTEEGDDHDQNHELVQYVVEEMDQTRLETALGTDLLGDRLVSSTLSGDGGEDDDEDEEDKALSQTARGISVVILDENNDVLAASPQALKRCVGGVSPLSLDGGARVFYKAQNLSPHEATVFGMRGVLPETQLAHTKSTKKGGGLPPVNSNKSSGATKDKKSVGLAKPIGFQLGLGTDAELKLVVDEFLTGQAPGGKLDLYNFHLSQIPCSINEGGQEMNLSKLTILDLGDNCIEVLPEWVGTACVNLQQLLLGKNKLKTLPDSLGDLSKLVILQLNHNQLSDIPVTLVAIEGLKTISLDYNQLHAIPECVWSMPQLSTLYVAQNPIEQWPSIEKLTLSSAGTLTLGIDNHPTLWTTYREEMIFEQLGDRLTVVWNKVYPDVVIPNRLYLGSLKSAQLLPVYERLGIGAVLTVGRDLKPVLGSDMRHETIIVDDIVGASFEDSFSDCFGFIDSCPTENPTGKPAVLVHCFAGMSRSSTCVIGYLMTNHKMRLDDAYLMAQEARSVIYPNDGFFEQLLRLDEKLYPRTTSEGGKGGGYRPLKLDGLGRKFLPALPVLAGITPTPMDGEAKQQPPPQEQEQSADVMAGSVASSADDNAESFSSSAARVQQGAVTWWDAESAASPLVASGNTAPPSPLLPSSDTGPCLVAATDGTDNIAQIPSSIPPPAEVEAAGIATTAEPDQGFGARVVSTYGCEAEEDSVPSLPAPSGDTTLGHPAAGACAATTITPSQGGRPPLPSNRTSLISMMGDLSRSFENYPGEAKFHTYMDTTPQDFGSGYPSTLTSRRSSDSQPKTPKICLDHLGVDITSDAQLQEIFNMFDPNGDGRVSLAEFRSVFKDSFENFGAPMEDRDVDRLFAKFDNGAGKKNRKAHDGYLSYEEFCILILNRLRQ